MKLTIPIVYSVRASSSTQKVWVFVVVEMVKELDYCGSYTKGHISRMTKICFCNIRVTNYSHRNRPHFIVTYYTYLGETQSCWKRTRMKGPIKTLAGMQFACTKSPGEGCKRIYYPGCSYEICEIAVVLKSWDVPRTVVCWTSAVGRSSNSPVSMFSAVYETMLAWISCFLFSMK